MHENHKYITNYGYQIEVALSGTVHVGDRTQPSCFGDSLLHRPLENRQRAMVALEPVDVRSVAIPKSVSDTNT